MKNKRYEIRNDKNGVYYYDTLTEDRLSPYEVVGMLNQTSFNIKLNKNEYTFIESED